MHSWRISCAWFSNRSPCTNNDEEIRGSFWGESEAGLIGQGLPDRHDAVAFRLRL